MNRIIFIRLTNANNNRTNELIYIRRDDIENIMTNRPDDTGRRGNSMIRAKGNNYFVEETPEQVIAMINEGRFGTQQVR
jgi:hypothetical protein